MPLRIAVLGFAHGHVAAYLTRWRKEPALGIEPLAGWDHDAARLAKAAQDFGLSPVSSLDALLARADIDAFVIAAETAYHAELVEKAAATGKPVILQKPLALTLEQADRIVAAVERHRVPFTLAWQMRVDPHNLKMKELLASGQFGRLLQLRRRHCLSTHTWPNFETLWHNDPALNRDIFADDAAHAIDFIYFLLGRPVSVTAELGTLVNPKVPNDNAIAIFRYSDGAFAEASCSFTAVAGENTTEILCQHGVIIGNYGDAPSNAARPAGAPQLKWYLHADKKWTVSEIPEIPEQGWRIANLAGPLADFLCARRPPLATAAEARDVLQMTLACYESHAAGRRVPLFSHATT